MFYQSQEIKLLCKNSMVTQLSPTPSPKLTPSRRLQIGTTTNMFHSEWQSNSSVALLSTETMLNPSLRLRSQHPRLSNRRALHRERLSHPVLPRLLRHRLDPSLQPRFLHQITREPFSARSGPRRPVGSPRPQNGRDAGRYFCAPVGGGGEGAILLYYFDDGATWGEGIGGAGQGDGGG